MAGYDLELAEALGAGCQDLILAEGVEHARLYVTGVCGDGAEAQDDDRDDLMLRLAPSGYRQPAQLNGKEILQKRGQDEHRDGDAQNCDEHDDIIGQLVFVERRDDTRPDTDDKTDDIAAAEPANALEKIKADGVLTVALSPDFSPMEFVDSSKTGQDQYVGFDITLAKYIAENLGVELVIEPMGFDASQTAVYTGSVPMSISGYSWTEDRAENYELSDYYYAGENETRQALLIKKENADKYTSPEDLAGQDVGAQNASLQMQLVTEQLTDANPISIGDITVGVMELKSGNIEALAVAYGNAEMIVDANPDLAICTWEFDVKAEYSANVIMMQKGETELLDAVNAILAQAKEANLYDGWYKDAVELGKSENAQELTLG